MSDLNAIRSRLGSIAPSRMHMLPGSVQRLLTQDLPHLLNLLEEANAVLEEAHKAILWAEDL